MKRSWALKIPQREFAFRRRSAEGQRKAHERFIQWLLCFKIDKNHFVNFTGATFVLATHVEGSFSSTSLSGDMKIFFIANIL